jgi:hypothetical protein
MSEKKPLGITELVLRDAHQSLLATRMRIDDMLPIAGELDKIGFWSIESWGGATFDACIRYLGEDPWERIRRLKAAMPNTPQQMLLCRRPGREIRRTRGRKRRGCVSDLRRAERPQEPEDGGQGYGQDRQACPGNHFVHGEPRAYNRSVGRSRQAHRGHGRQSICGSISASASRTWAPIRSVSRTWPDCCARMSHSNS